MEYCKARLEDTNSLKVIFQECFGESPENTNVYFEHLIDYSNAYVAKDGDNICASLYLLPSTICLDKIEYKSNYLFGAGTLPQYRKKGIMENLINVSLDIALKDGDKFSALLPASQNLYGYYSKFDYIKTYKCKVITLKYEDLQKLKVENSKNIVKNMTIFDNISNLRFNIVSRVNGSMNFNKTHLQAVDNIFKLYNGKLAVFDMGYVAYYKDSNKIFIQEIICRDENFKDLICSFSRYVKSSEYVLRVPIQYNDELLENSRILDFGMIKLLDNNLDIDIKKDMYNSYLGLTLD